MSRGELPDVLDKLASLRVHNQNRSGGTITEIFLPLDPNPVAAPSFRIIIPKSQAFVRATGFTPS
jgi:hypothetical protein